MSRGHAAVGGSGPQRRRVVSSRRKANLERAVVHDRYRNGAASNCLLSMSPQRSTASAGDHLAKPQRPRTVVPASTPSPLACQPCGPQPEPAICRDYVSSKRQPVPCPRPQHHLVCGEAAQGELDHVSLGFRFGLSALHQPGGQPLPDHADALVVMASCFRILHRVSSLSGY